MQHSETNIPTLNIATKITVFRIFLIPFFVVTFLYYIWSLKETGNWFRYVAVIIFAIAVISDVADGYIARKKKLITFFGSFLDPVADKLFLWTAIILIFVFKEYFYQKYSLELWYPILVIGRDIFVGIGNLILYLNFGRFRYSPSIMGKVAVILQMGVILWILLKLPHPYFIYYTTAFPTVVSGIIYFLWWFKQIRSLQK